MKKWGIIGCIVFFVAVAFGFFFKFDGALIIAIAGGAFGLCAISVSAWNDAKKKEIKPAIAGVIIGLAVIGGVLCCIGGMNQTIFAEISGAALTLLAVIFGLVFKN